MRNIIVSNYVTLDGFFEGPNREIDWFVWDDEVEQYGIDLLDRIDTILFGRVTYELMAGYWPTTTEENPAITQAMNSLPKIVFSRTLDHVSWNNSRLVKGDLRDEVLKLKEGPGKDIVIYGSGSIVAALTNVGLIDEYQMMVNPVILGSGKPMFQGVEKPVKLKLIRSRPFDIGNVLLYYQPE